MYEYLKTNILFICLHTKRSISSWNNLNTNLNFYIYNLKKKLYLQV